MNVRHAYVSRDGIFISRLSAKEIGSYFVFSFLRLLCQPAMTTIPQTSKLNNQQAFN